MKAEYLIPALAEENMQIPEEEYTFHPTRKWRFDFAYPDIKLAIEIEGSVFGRNVYCNTCKKVVTRRLKDGRVVTVREGGRHTSGAGYEKDCEKYNNAAILGWRVLRFSTTMKVNDIINTIKEAVLTTLEGD